MYIEKITLKENLSEEELSKLIKIAENSFDNYVGKLPNVGQGNELIFQGESDKELCIIGVGAVDLYDNKDFLNCVHKWTFENTNEPGDCSDDVIASFKHGEELCRNNNSY